jgi:hypothetical protein
MNLALIRTVGKRHCCGGFGNDRASGEWREKQIPHCVRDDRKKRGRPGGGFGMTEKEEARRTLALGLRSWCHPERNAKGTSQISGGLHALGAERWAPVDREAFSLDIPFIEPIQVWAGTNVRCSSSASVD